MNLIKGTDPPAEFSFTSSVKDDVWLPGKGPRGYEWWYFDALSDTEREAVVIIFLDNFIFSPRYNSLNRELEAGSAVADARLFPAVAFTYYRDGKPLFRSINEYSGEEFFADPEWPHCRIGRNSFRYDSAPYGEGYKVEIDAPLRGGKRILATFEWLSIESGLLDGGREATPGVHSWNLVAPRSDVTGKVSIIGADGKETDEAHFRGTGYHDHNSDTRWMPAAVDKWTWGRAHFAGATAVYYDYRGIGGNGDHSMLYLIDGGGFRPLHAEFRVEKEKRDVFGLKYPNRMTVEAEDGTVLEVESKCVIDSSFFYNRLVYEANLRIPGEEPKASCGLGEYLVPGKLRRGIFDKLIDMRIGKGGSAAFLP